MKNINYPNLKSTAADRWLQNVGKLNVKKSK